MENNSIYKILRLHISPDKFYIEPRDPKSLGEKILEIDRVTQELNLTENEGQIPPSAETKDIFGIMGIIHLLAGPYLIVITRKRLVGYIQGNEIWKVLGTEVFPFPKALLHLTEDQVYYNKIYLSMITSVLQTDGFYFSCSYDLTHTVQRLSSTSPEFQQMPLFERVDPRFAWNNHLLRQFTVQPELQNFILPVVHGFISITTCTINQTPFDFILISRRSCYRAGVRYYIRGLDDEGRSANYVETEQIIQLGNGAISSFVQIRGSIPLYWTQRPNLKYKPKPVISGTQDHSLVFRYHIDNEIAHYRDLVLINLIDQKGSEKSLGDNFSTILRNAGYPQDKIRYDAFDFHKECSKMRWDRLNILIDRQDTDLKRFGYFSKDKDGIINSEQKGIFRTNCIDSLDRTNVVQSMLAAKSLEYQLEEFGIITTGEKITQYKDFEFIFKNVWADNADACSVQYAGTGALKTDFTRTGNRTILGALRDGMNSAIRYYKNNFSDGYRQDSIDLFLGNYVVEANECVTKSCPLQQKRDWRFMALPFILLFGFSMFIISLILPSTNYGIQFLYVLFWGVAVLLTLYVLVFFGVEFVDKPRLVLPKESKDKDV